MNKKNFSFINKLAQLIYDKKGGNILALDVEGHSSICDYILIAEGNVERHVIAIGQAILQEMKQENLRAFHVEGLQDGDWLVIDFGHVHVHLFLPDVRQKYQLERIWEEAKLIELSIDTEEREPIGIF